MALKKSIAGYLTIDKVDVMNEDGSFSHTEERRGWVDQRDIEMHPLEEKAILAHWAIHDVKIKLPEKLSQQQEHELLIEHGADYVKQKRAEWQAAYDALLPEIEAAEKAHQEHHDTWNKHVEFCVANGFDKDFHDKEKYMGG